MRSPTLPGRLNFDVYFLFATLTAAVGAGVASTVIANIRGIVLTIVLALVAVIHYFTAIRQYGVLSPDGLFFSTQLVMAVGTFQLADRGSSADTQYATIVAAATTAYTLASLTTFLIITKGRIGPTAYEVSIVRPNRTFKVLLAISLVIVVAYFSAVGYSAFFVGIQGEVSGQRADVASLRLESYAGGRYLFPGYVNQFKNAILPGLALVFATWAASRASLFVRLISWLLLAFSAVGMMWTGQRGAFVSFVLTATVYAVLYNRRKASRWVLLIPLAGLPLLLLSTVVLARGDSAVGGVTARLFNDNQLSGIAAFRYTSNLPTQWGAEWMQSILGILPGNRGSTLSGEVFATLYGSTRGTSPPSIWGSAHYNFGVFGVLITAVVLGVVVQTWTSRSLRKDNYNTIQLVGLAGATVSFGTWIADGPTTLLNVGLIAYLSLWWWGKRIAGAESSTSATRTVQVSSGRPPHPPR